MTSPHKKDVWLIMLYGWLLIAGLLLAIQGLMQFFRGSSLVLLGLGVLAVMIPASLYPIAAAVHRTAHLLASQVAQLDEQRRGINPSDPSGKTPILLADGPAIRQVIEAEQARERRKQDLERDFLAAAERDDVDRAMHLLKELDKYLTESEAEPYRETARGVITKAKQNLGVKFKLAVHHNNWTEALHVGDQIVHEFPNTRMADEVRGMQDLLQGYADGHQE